MMRAAELAARRRVLLARCDAQRAELEYRFAQLNPRRWARAVAAGIAGGGVRRVGRHPLAWLALIGSFLILGRTREALTFLVWARSALTLASRATQILSLVGLLRRRSA
ncbi:MAG TPA: hypothetical protein VKB72_11955 [Steroidobacteraceae bacterium]|nr:hypothetical protein [Steroidobacteraceae bacterium]